MATPVKYRNGLMGTILFHGGLLLVLLFVAFRTPLPLPEELGILVDFGNSDTGFGDYEPPMGDPAPVKSRPASPRTSQPEEQILTQNHEETAALPVKPVVKPVEKTKKEPQNDTQNDTQSVEPLKPVERTPDQRAMFTPGRGDPSSTATSQGEAGGQGNQGVPTGAPDVHVYGPGGDTGGGGNKWELSGRKLVGRLPSPTYDVQDQGVVVVEITVDKDGNVTKVRPGVKGTTATNKSLLDAAAKAARQAKFSPNPNAVEQIGKITYNFILQGE